MIAFIIVIFRRKNNHKNTVVSCNSETSTKVKEGKKLNEEDYINPTFRKLEGNNDYEVVVISTKAKEEKELNEDYINPTFRKLQGNDYETATVPNYETINEIQNVYEEV